MSTLHEIAARYRELRAFQEVEPYDPETGEVLSPDDVRAELDALDATLEQKAEAVCYRLDELKGQAAALKEIESRAADRRKARESRTKMLRAYLFGALQAAKKAKVSTTLHTVSLSEGQERVEVEDPAQLPGKFYLATVPGEVLESVEMLLAAVGTAGGFIGELAAHLRRQIDELDTNSRVPRLDAVKRALNAGEPVPGAGLVDGEPHLVIR